MGEYASKGLAWTGLGFGLAGSVLGLSNNNCGCGGGLLGNLFGGNCNRNGAFAEVQYVSELQSRIAKLEAEKYSDQVGKEVYKQSLSDLKELRNEMYAFIKPLSEEAANNRVNIATLTQGQQNMAEQAALQAQITAGKINEAAMALNGKIDVMNATNTGAFNSLNQTIACINGEIADLTKRVNNITNEVIPLCKVCPQPMPRFNSYTAPTALAPDCGTCSCSASSASA